MLKKIFLKSGIIKELMHSSDTLVVDTNPQIHVELKKLNISAIHLNPTRNVRIDWGNRDSNFKGLFMDGDQLKCNFPDTTLPVWKVVALDRFSFWFTDKESAELYDMICALEWDKCIASADLNSDLAWTLVWGMKTSGFRTREWYDLGMIGNVPFAGLYVGSESDKSFLSEFVQQIPIETVNI